MKVNTVILLAVVALVAGCATKPPPTASHYDPITGVRTDISENLLPSPATPREVLFLNMFRDYRNPRRISYFLEVLYMAPKDAGYLEIAPGDTLTIIADGKPMKFTGSGSINRRRGYRQNRQDFVKETAWYDVSKSDLQKLASAKEIKVQVKGNNGLVERDFGPENYENLKAFVSKAAR